MRPLQVGLVLAAINIAAWVAFLAFRSPLDSAYVARLDQDREVARAEGAVVIEYNSAITVIGCRPIVNPNHGPELLVVRFMQLTNLPAMLLSMLALTVVVPRQLGYCTESWIHAGLFLLLSAAQWVMFGALATGLWRRFRGVVTAGL